MNTVELNQSKNILKQLGSDVRKFIGAYKTKPGSPWRSLKENTDPGSPLHKISGGHSAELAKRSLAQWQAVKYWEIVHRFKLQDKAQEIYSGDYREAYAEKLSWPLNGPQSVHPIAPHIVATNIINFNSDDLSQSVLKGKYDSTAWYQLNLILDAGARKKAMNQPVDWPYQFRHIYEVSIAAKEENPEIFRDTDFQPTRMLGSFMKAYQMNELPGLKSNSFEWNLRYVSPFWILVYPEMYESLENIEKGLHRKVVEATVIRFLQITQSIKSDEWTICADEANNTQRWACIQNENFVPEPAPKENISAKKRFSMPDFYHANDFFRMFPLLKKIGVTQKTRNSLRE